MREEGRLRRPVARSALAFARIPAKRGRAQTQPEVLDAYAPVSRCAL